MQTNLQFSADLFTFTKEIINGKLHFCAVPYDLRGKYLYPRPVLQNFKIFCLIATSLSQTFVRYA